VPGRPVRRVDDHVGIAGAAVSEPAAVAIAQRGQASLIIFGCGFRPRCVLGSAGEARFKTTHQVKALGRAR
jgi:hypothetical protein